MSSSSHKPNVFQKAFSVIFGASRTDEPIFRQSIIQQPVQQSIMTTTSNACDAGPSQAIAGIAGSIYTRL